MANETDTRYRYSGPLSGVTLRVAGEAGTVKEVEKALHPGAEVLLPADHPYVRKLMLKGFLTEVAAQSSPTEQADQTDQNAQTKTRQAAKVAAPQEETTNAG